MNELAKNKSRTRLEQRETDILDAATDLFAADGFHATSTRKIAAAAGVSEGTVFHYFSTKNALLLAILDSFYEGLTESAREGIQEVMNTRDRLLFLAQNHTSKLLAKQALMMRLIQVYVSVDASYYGDYKNTHIHDLNYRYTRIFDGVILEGIERGNLSSGLHLPAIRDLFFGGLEYGIRTLLGKNSTDDITSYVQQIIDPIWSSMQAPGGEKNNGARKLEKRLEQACLRIEEVAGKLEQDAQ